MGEVKYDVRAVFEKVPEIMGMEMRRHGENWEGGYYLNGERHSWRRDKLKVYKFKGSIWVAEEGGQNISLTTWLQNYGGAADFWDAVRILKGIKAPVIMEHIHRAAAVKYIDPNVLQAAKQWDLKKCPLFNWMCTMFPEEKVRSVWDMYNVTTDGNGNAVFWAMDAEGRLLHDKKMKYLPDGHRDRTYGGGRKYTTAEGYSGRCLFGAHLAEKCRHIRVVESEKTALLGALYTGKVFVATGGKNGLHDVDGRMILYPDIDAIEEWSNKKGAIIQEWWKGWNGIEEHSDYGDFVVSQMKSRNIL